MTHPGIRSTALALVLLVLALPAILSAQPAFRVKDLNTTVSRGTGYLGIPGVAIDGVAFFVREDGIHGGELWRSDGSEAGTWLVKDICPGVCPSLPHYLSAAGDTLFFIADDGVNGLSLWKSNGTGTGTVLVKRIEIDPHFDSIVTVQGLSQDLAVFVVNVNAFDYQLWKTDGTAAGTTYLATFGRVNDNRSLRPLAVLGGSLLFAATDQAGLYGWEIWKTDGTAAGTALLEDIYPGSSGSVPTYPLVSPVAGGRIFFSASGPSGTSGLWVTDGTEAGTVHVKPLGLNTSFDSPANFTVLGSDVYFPASDSGDGLEIWKSDGTEAGTVRVTDFANGNFRELTAAGGKVFFLHDDGVHGLELWKTDGTEAGTALVKDIHPGEQPSVYQPTASLAEVDGALMFFASDGVSGIEPWRSDGTEAGTSRVADLYPGGFSSFPPSGRERGLAAGGLLFFRAVSPNVGIEQWVTDGTAAGTLLLRVNQQMSAFELLSTGDLKGPAPMTDLGGTLLFQGGTGESGAELSRSDGTEAGTYLLLDLHGGTYSSFPHEFTRAGNTLFFRAGFFDDFTAPTPAFGDLWKTDGTVAGTVLLTYFFPAWGGEPRDLTPAGDKLLFVADEPGENHEVLWKSDGTANGTGPVQDGSTDMAHRPRDLEAFGNRVFFSSDGPAQDEELWASDGTNAGTVLVKDLEPGPFSISRPGHFEALGSTLFFTAYTNSIGRELWKTDGTDAGTVLVKDIAVGSSFRDTFRDTERRLAAAGSTLFFIGESYSTPFVSTLWKSDGTAPGTVPLRDFYRPIRSLTPVGNRVYFTVDDGAHGGELWVSNGTVAGTRMVEDILPGSGSSTPQQLTALGHVLLFSATDGVHGRELWRSNGREAGTRQVQDIAPGALSSSPLSFTPSGANLYFAANDNQTGFELWAAPRNALLATFGDVPTTHWAWPYIEALAQSGITSGCGSGAGYCPGNTLSRAEMAIFLGRGLYTADFVPPAATGTRFGDVPANFWAGAWIEQIATAGITQGCSASPPLFCPGSSVTRAEMAIFLLRAKHGGSYTPPTATGTVFTDVPANHWAAAWIERLAAEYITSGCAPGRYCPGDLVNRAEMAVFLTRAFGLTMP